MNKNIWNIYEYDLSYVIYEGTGIVHLLHIFGYSLMNFNV